uniref:Uncharacterized protein n=1 Tax=Magallana gigas TaxID=29159 RepID=A0A8W8MCY0_MAGGI
MVKQRAAVMPNKIKPVLAARRIDDEKAQTLGEALLLLCIDLHPLDGPKAVIRVDPAPGFLALCEDALLDCHRINLEIGRGKNVNKNPVAEKELEEEILRQEPGGGPVSQLSLSTAVTRLNSRIRDGGLSAREMYIQRNQFTHEQLSMCDKDIIVQKQAQRDSNHTSGALSKANSKGPRPPHVPFYWRSC